MYFTYIKKEIYFQCHIFCFNLEMIGPNLEKETPFFIFHKDITKKGNEENIFLNDLSNNNSDSMMESRSYFPIDFYS